MCRRVNSLSQPTYDDRVVRNQRPGVSLAARLSPCGLACRDPTMATRGLNFNSSMFPSKLSFPGALRCSTSLSGPSISSRPVSPWRPVAMTRASRSRCDRLDQAEGDQAHGHRAFAHLELQGQAHDIDFRDEPLDRLADEAFRHEEAGRKLISASISANWSPVLEVPSRKNSVLSSHRRSPLSACKYKWPHSCAKVKRWRFG